MIEHAWGKGTGTRFLVIFCVEVHLTDDNMVEVRDSKDPDGATLKYNLAEWQCFIDAVKNSEFDIPKKLAPLLEKQLEEGRMKGEGSLSAG